MCRPSKSSGDEANIEQHSTPEIFECLYLFGMFYLQIYLEKTISFLDYCSHLSVCTHTSLPDGLLKNDTELQGWYVSYPIIIGHKIILR